MTKLTIRKTVYMLAALYEAFEDAKEADVFGHHDVQLLFPKDLPVPDDAKALIVPLDYQCLDARGRGRLLAELPALAPDVPTAAYGYDFDDETPSTHNGVAVARKLNKALVARVLGGVATTRRAA